MKLISKTVRLFPAFCTQSWKAKKHDSLLNRLLVSGKNCGYAENVAAKIAARENTSFLVDVMRCFGLGTSTAQAVEGRNFNTFPMPPAQQ